MEIIKEKVGGYDLQFHFARIKSDEGAAITLYLKPISRDAFEELFRENGKVVLENILDSKMGENVSSFTKIHVVSKNDEMQIQYVPN